MNHARICILSTLAYYRALRAPALTPLEILRYWTAPPTEQKNEPSALYTKPSLRLILSCLEELTRGKLIKKSNGYYALKETPDSFFGECIRGRKISAEKRRVFFRIARFFPYIPFVRIVALTGSVARDHATEQSDIDVLIVSAPSRIWTARLLVGLFTFILGKYRNASKIRDRICLNHYIALCAKEAAESPSSASLGASPPLWEPRMLTTAHIYAQAMPYWEPKLFSAMGTYNEWMRAFIPFMRTERMPAFSSSPSRVLMAAKGIAEIAIQLAGGWGERIARSVQYARIARAVGTKTIAPIELVINENTLLFHYPVSRSKFALQQYNEFTQRMTMGVDNSA